MQIQNIIKQINKLEKENEKEKEEEKTFYNYGQFNYLENAKIMNREFYLDKTVVLKTLLDYPDYVEIENEQELNIYFNKKKNLKKKQAIL